MSIRCHGKGEKSHQALSQCLSYVRKTFLSVMRNCKVKLPDNSKWRKMYKRIPASQVVPVRPSHMKICGISQNAARSKKRPLYCSVWINFLHVLTAKMLQDHTKQRENTLILHFSGVLQFRWNLQGRPHECLKIQNHIKTIAATGPPRNSEFFESVATNWLFFLKGILWKVVCTRSSV